MYSVHDARNSFASYPALDPGRTRRADLRIGLNAAGAETHPTESTDGDILQMEMNPDPTKVICLEKLVYARTYVVLFRSGSHYWRSRK